MKLDLNQIIALAEIFGGNTNEASTFTPHIGKKCIIRTYASGVHYGKLVAQSGRQVELENARRIWRFDVKTHGVSLSEVAIFGPVDSRTKICETVPEMTILDALEIIPASMFAQDVIEKAETYKP